ncbi:class A beta-lactamase [Elizabethkingia occulta]|uniref:beta-lactamase n=1 Tax=Elizabethkingia occulta TaxID=1867263 RepID=A0A1T3M9C8_9FLAO|nr:class A beta-lactamase [Elizabethkingia occulta]OPB86457.1 class A beta-lactamase [Elizabethkingia occulta]OPC61193.1 class A beta-lactamase [Elizabethkingia occulta]
MAKRAILCIVALFLSISVFSQTRENPQLKKTLESIISGKKSIVGISVMSPDEKEMTGINANQMLPMLSTVKFPLALAALHEVEKGKLSMNQKLFIKKEELLDDTWSPFKEKYPAGNITITLEEALKWTVSYSDNNLTDILIRLIGGPETVQEFMDSSSFIIKNNEEGMHKDWDSQFINKITPNFAVLLLQEFSNSKILNKTNTQWLYNAMLNNVSGKKRLKGNLPTGVKVAHRTGTSFTNKEGMTGAINDYGIIELPGKKKIYIAVFVHNTYESFDDSEKIISDIGRAAYDYYSNKK